jgi:TonB family protein
MPYAFSFLSLAAAIGGAAQPSADAPAPILPLAQQAQLLAEFYPDKAQRMEKSGDASARCTITATGNLTDCAIVTENPTGYDFGAATIRVAKRMQLQPPYRAGASVTVPLHWRISTKDLQAPTTPETGR